MGGQMTDENKASFEREIKLEQQLADMTKDRNWHKQAYQGLVNGLADTASLQATIAQLQATLAAREARIQDLQRGLAAILQALQPFTEAQQARGSSGGAANQVARTM